MEFHWFALKGPIVAALGISPVAMHSWLGGFIILGAVALLRHRPERWIFAWYSVLALALINEALDTFDWIRGSRNFDAPNAVLDVVVTMAIPTAVLIGVRWFRRNRQAPVEETLKEQE